MGIRNGTEKTMNGMMVRTTRKQYGLGLKIAFKGDGSGRVLWPHTPWQVGAIFCAEFMGTFLLLFLGCMGTMWILGSDQPAPHLQVALTFGFVVAMNIATFGHTSSAHFNPAVSVCSLMLGRIRILTFFVYILAQMLGAVLGVGLLKALAPYDTCCQTCLTVLYKEISPFQGFLVEFIITAMLIFVVNAVWDERHDGVFDAVPIKFGVTIAGIAMAAGSWTGASMNPARTFGPCVWENDWEDHWVYWVGPICGSVFATLYYSYLLNNDRAAPKKIHEELGLTTVKNDTGHRQEE